MIQKASFCCRKIEKDIFNMEPESELSEFPFLRSEKAIRSLAYVRGAASGFKEQRHLCY